MTSMVWSLDDRKNSATMNRSKSGPGRNDSGFQDSRMVRSRRVSV